MKKIITILLLAFGCYGAKGQALEVPELQKFIGKNWRASDVNLSHCKYFYYSILVDTDEQGIIQHWKHNNVVPTEVKKDFDYLKTFQFPPKYGLENSRVLFYITVDQTMSCPGATAHIQQTNEVMAEVLQNIALEINSNPNTKIMFRPIAMKYYKSSHGN